MAASSHQWYRYAHIVLFVVGLFPLYFILTELLRAAGILNPVSYIGGRGFNPDDQVYGHTFTKPLGQADVSLAHDMWLVASRENTALVREFRRQKNLAPLVIDEGPPEAVDRRMPIVMAAEFDDYVYPSNAAGTQSDVVGVLLGRWVPNRPRQPDVSRLAERVQALESQVSQTAQPRTQTA